MPLHLARTVFSSIRSSLRYRHRREELSEEALLPPWATERVTCGAEGKRVYTLEHGSGLKAYVVESRDGGVSYCVNEPEYSPEDLKTVVRAISEGVRKGVNPLSTVNLLNPRNLEEYLLAKVSSGLGKVYPLLIDGMIEELAMNRPGEPVHVFHRSLAYWVPSNVVLAEPEASRVVLSMSNMISKPLSPAFPMAEGATRDGLRFALTLGDEVTPRGSSFVIRKMPSRPFSVPELIREGLLTDREASYLWFLLENRAFIMIIGGMATGKTTLLQALLDLLPGHMRIVTIEDTPEIALMHPNWDSLTPHKGFFQGSGRPEPTLYDLARFALRRRADFLVVGEVRGEEARILFQAANTGQGSICLPPWEKLVVKNEEGRVVAMAMKDIIEKLNEGKELKVLSFSTEGYAFWKRPTHWVLTFSSYWVSVRTSDGGTLMATPDHEALAYEEGAFKLKRFDELRVGDKLVRLAGTPEGMLRSATSYEPDIALVRVAERKLVRRRAFALDISLGGGSRLMVHSNGLVTHNCTFHADSVETAVSRLTAPPISLHRAMIRTVWTFVTLGFRGGRRKVIGIDEVNGMTEDLDVREVKPILEGEEPFLSLVKFSTRLKGLAKVLELGEEELADELATRAEFLKSLSKRTLDPPIFRRYIEAFYSTRRNGVS